MLESLIQFDWSLKPIWMLDICQYDFSTQDHVIGICNFDIVCYLSIVIWDFSNESEVANRFYLNQIELTLTLPWSGGARCWQPARFSFFIGQAGIVV